METSILSSEEKYFLACFLTLKYVDRKPVYKKCISLYTYLDGTNESKKDQLAQLHSHDIDLIDWLNLLRKNPFNTNTSAFVNAQLKKYGYLDNKQFILNFRKVASWLGDVDDVQSYCDHVKAEGLKTIERVHQDNTVKQLSSFNWKDRKTLEETEDEFIEKAFRKNNAEFPGILTPSKVLSPEFESESRFFTAIVALQLLNHPELSIPEPDFYTSFVFTSNESLAIDRWSRKYQAIKEKLEAQDLELAKSKNRLYEESRRKREIYDEHVARILKNSRQRSNSKIINDRNSQDSWGRSERPRLNTDGNDWREQE